MSVQKNVKRVFLKTEKNTETYCRTVLADNWVIASVSLCYWPLKNLMTLMQWWYQQRVGSGGWVMHDEPSWDKSQTTHRVALTARTHVHQQFLTFQPLNTTIGWGAMPSPSHRSALQTKVLLSLYLDIWGENLVIILLWFCVKKLLIWTYDRQFFFWWTAPFGDPWAPLPTKWKC